MKNKFIIVVTLIIFMIIGFFGSIKVYKIITRFEYDKLPKISFNESKNLNDSCAYVFYTLDNDKLTDFAIGSIYDLNNSISKECNIYVVYMNDLENQKGYNSLINNNIYLESLPLLISVKDNEYNIEKVFINDNAKIEE